MVAKGKADDDEIKELKDRLTKLEENDRQTISLLTEIKLGLCGSEKIGVEGMVQKVRRHEIYIEKDKKQKYKVLGAAMVIFFLLGWLKDSIIEFFKRTG